MKKKVIEKKLEDKIQSSEKLNNQNFISKSIYGTILIYALIIVEENTNSSFLQVVLSIIFTSFAIVIAEFYSEIIAALFVKKKRLIFDEVKEIFKETIPVIIGSQIPTLVFILAHIFDFSRKNVFLLTKLGGIFALFLYGYLTGKNMYNDKKRALKVGFINIAIGSGIIVIKALLH